MCFGKKKPTQYKFKFFQNNDKSSHIDPDRKKLDYHEFEVFKDPDFMDQMTADFFYEEHRFIPYGCFKLFSDTEENPYGDKIKNIFIIFKKSDLFDKKLTEDEENELSQINITFKPFKLFMHAFWEKIGIDLLESEFRVDHLLDELKTRKELGCSRKYIRHTLIYYPYLFNYHELDIFIIMNNIWNEYCLTEGKTSIDRDHFSLWLYRMNSIIFDLFEFPYLEEDEYRWEKRYLFIRELIKDENSKKYEYYCEKNWNEILKKRFTKEMSTNVRIMDAKELLNEFFEQIKPISALERFLISFYESFGNKLYEDNLLIKCSSCGEFIKYKKGKKYCSILVEGKDCGKKARNKRYYEKTGKKRLEKYRESTRALRKFYKEKGIKK